MKLSWQQKLLIQHTAETQRARGEPAHFLIGQHKTQTFQSLIKRGILKGKRGIVDGGGRFHRDHYEVELTTAGWDCANSIVRQVPRRLLTTPLEKGQ